MFWDDIAQRCVRFIYWVWLGLLLKFCVGELLFLRIFCYKKMPKMALINCYWDNELKSEVVLLYIVFWCFSELCDFGAIIEGVIIWRRENLVVNNKKKWNGVSAVLEFGVFIMKAKVWVGWERLIDIIFIGGLKLNDLGCWECSAALDLNNLDERVWCRLIMRMVFKVRFFIKC